MNCPRNDDVTAEHSYWRGDRTCSFCGSMHPDDFMAAIKGGNQIVPTDKNYKAYVKTSNGGQQKFYFQHLDIHQQDEFIRLYNAKSLSLATPGRFYVPPFFTVAQQAY
jgi:hypothetical protein